MAIAPRTEELLTTALKDRDAAKNLINNVNAAISESDLSNTAITTNGAGTLTAAAMTGGVITRSGSTAAYTDTTATAAQLNTAKTVNGTAPAYPASWLMYVKNTVAFNETIAAGSGVTVSGVSIIPPNSIGVFLVSLTSATAATVVGLGAGPLTTAPVSAITTYNNTDGTGTLAAAAIVGGVINRTGETTAFTDTTDTAAAIIAALPNVSVGYGFFFAVKNTVPFAGTLAAGASVTLAGQTIIPPNSVGLFHCKVTAATTVTITGVQMAGMTQQPLRVATALTTVGAGTITAAGIAGGVTTRGGAQSATAFSDTTDTAANIIAALPNANVGQSFEWVYRNNTDGAATITGDTGVTVSGITVVPKNTWARFLVTYTAAATVTIVGVEAGDCVVLPAAQFKTATTSNGTAAAGELTGAKFVVMKLTANGANAYTTRTGAEMFADIPNVQVGTTYILRLISGGDNTVTLTAAASGVTITGTATVATGKFRDFHVSVTAADTFVFQDIGGN